MPSREVSNAPVRRMIVTVALGVGLAAVPAVAAPGAAVAAPSTDYVAPGDSTAA